jgi:adenylate cyclase
MERDVLSRLRALGIPEEAIDRALARGDPEGAIFDSVLLPSIAERTVSAAEIEAAGGLEVEETLALITGFGLPAPGAQAPAFTPEEAHAFIELGELRDVWPLELAVQLSRVYGRHLSRVAQTGVQLFRAYVEPRLREQGGDRLAGMHAVQTALGRLIPLAEPLIMGVYWRWLEHELAQAAVQEVERDTEAPLPGAVEVTLLFCDLKDFTAYADAEGDAAAVAAIDRFTETVVRERGPGSRLTKLLGDGAMLAYADAVDALTAGQRTIESLRNAPGPGVHASAHSGVAVLREGDYFGGVVNLAARVLALAGRDELLATRPVMQAGGERFAWEPAGTVRVRGVGQPVELFRLATPRGPRG